MTLSDLAALGSFVSGVAVLVSLVFLWFQLRQMNDQVRQAEKNQRAAIRQAHSTRISETFLRRMETAELWVKVQSDDPDIDDVELYQVLQMGSAIWFSIEDSFYQHRDGLLDDAAWKANEAGLRTAASGAFMRATWQFARSSAVGSDFVAYVDALMAEVPAGGRANLIAEFRKALARETAAGRPPDSATASNMEASA